jgi:hypothetical protein
VACLPTGLTPFSGELLGLIHMMSWCCFMVKGCCNLLLLGNKQKKTMQQMINFKMAIFLLTQVYF